MRRKVCFIRTSSQENQPSINPFQGWCSPSLTASHQATPLLDPITSTQPQWLPVLQCMELTSGGTATMGTNPLVRGTSGGAYYGFPKKCAPQAQVLNTQKLGGRGNFKQHVRAEGSTLGMCSERHTWSLFLLLTFLLLWPSAPSEAQRNGSSRLQTATSERLSYKYSTYHPTLTRQDSPHLQPQGLGRQRQGG